MSFAISSPGTLGGYNNTALGFDMMPTSGRDTHVYFATAQNPRGVVNQEQYLNKVMSNPTPPKKEGISSGMKAPPIPAEMLLDIKKDTDDVSETLVKPTETKKSSTSEDTASDDEKIDAVTEGPSLTTLLREHELLIKYTRGDAVVKRIKRTLKKGAYNRFTKFKVGKKLPYSPQYWLDGELADFTGYMNNELLRVNIIEQLADWADVDSDDSEEDSSESSDSEEEEVVEVVKKTKKTTKATKKVVEVEVPEVIDDEATDDDIQEEEAEVESRESVEVNDEKDVDADNVDEMLSSEESD